MKHFTRTFAALVTAGSVFFGAGSAIASASEDAPTPISQAASPAPNQTPNPVVPAAQPPAPPKGPVGALAADTLKVRGVLSGAAGFDVRYFRGTKDITTLVYLGKYSTGDLAPGQTHLISVRFAPKSTAKYLAVKSADLTVRSANDPDVTDVVRARAARV